MELCNTKLFLNLTNRLQKREGKNWWVLVGRSSLLFRFQEATSRSWRFLFLFLSFSCLLFFFSFSEQNKCQLQSSSQGRWALPFSKAFTERLKDAFPRQNLGIRRPIALWYTLVHGQQSGHEDCFVQIGGILFLPHHQQNYSREMFRLSAITH